MNLPIVTNLAAAHDAARLRGPIRGLAPLIAEVHTDIRAAPVVALERRRRVGRHRTACVKIRGCGRRRDQRCQERNGAKGRLHCSLSFGSWGPAGGVPSGRPPASGRPVPRVGLAPSCALRTFTAFELNFPKMRRTVRDMTKASSIAMW